LEKRGGSRGGGPAKLFGGGLGVREKKEERDPKCVSQLGGTRPGGGEVDPTKEGSASGEGETKEDTGLNW